MFYLKKVSQGAGKMCRKVRRFKATDHATLFATHFMKKLKIDN